MALQFNLTANANPIGMVFDAAYARVTDASFDVLIPASPTEPAHTIHRLTITIWANAASYRKTPVLRKIVEVPVSAMQTIEQVYPYLATLPLFAGATIVA